MSKLTAILLLFFGLLATTSAAELKVAVASNFKSTAKKIVVEFEKKSPHKITLISGSTGSLYNAIYQGAPYDIFLSADNLRPQHLVSQQLAFENTVFTYAIGQLAFWMPNNKNLASNNINSAISSQTGKLAIANPRLAPYGLSSLKYLEKNHLSALIKSKLIKGNNVTQALQFVSTGNAQSGFVSLSELLHAGVNNEFVLLDSSSYPIIEQQAVILRRTQHVDAATQFLNFMKDEACDIILMSGYALEHPHHKVKQ